MTGDFGLQVSPASSMNRAQNGAGTGDPNQGVQEAIRTLSLRVPRVSGAQGFSPLINAPGGQGVATPGGMSLDQLLMQIFGNQRPQGSQGSMGQAPASSMGQSFQPSFTPGLGSDTGSGAPENSFGLQQTSAPAAPMAPAPPNTPSKFLPGTLSNEGYGNY
jgi:hypothetical protein